MTDNYLPCMTCFRWACYWFTEETDRFTLFAESMKMAIPENTLTWRQFKFLEKNLQKCRLKEYLIQVMPVDCMFHWAVHSKLYTTSFKIQYFFRFSVSFTSVMLVPLQNSWKKVLLFLCLDRIQFKSVVTFSELLWVLKSERYTQMIFLINWKITVIRKLRNEWDFKLFMLSIKVSFTVKGLTKTKFQSR